MIQYSLYYVKLFFKKIQYAVLEMQRCLESGITTTIFHFNFMASKGYLRHVLEKGANHCCYFVSQKVTSWSSRLAILCCLQYTVCVLYYQLTSLEIPSTTKKHHQGAPKDLSPDASAGFRFQGRPPVDEGGSPGRPRPARLVCLCVTLQGQFRLGTEKAEVQFYPESYHPLNQAEVSGRSSHSE